MKKHFLTLTVLALVFGACSNEDEPEVTNRLTEPVAATFTAGISRAADNQWEAGDEVGIYAQNAAEAYSNVAYTVDNAGTSSNFTVKNEADKFFFTDENTVNFTAYYPYSATDVIAKSTNETQAGVDFLYAEASGNYQNPNIGFRFAHKMSRLTVKLAGDAATDNATVTLGGLKHDGQFDTKTGVASLPESAQVENWDVTLTGKEYTAIIYPQTATVSVTVDGKTATLEAKEFKVGIKYELTATVNQDQPIHVELTSGGNTIDDWGTEEPAQSGTKPAVAFMGSAASADALTAEEKAAYDWFATLTDYAVTYVPFTDDATTLSLNSYKMVWIHLDFVSQGLSENTNQLDADRANLVAASETLIKDYYANGGSLLLSRDALLCLTQWGIADVAINNVWGGNGDDASADIFADWGQAASHPLFAGFGLVGAEGQNALSIHAGANHKNRTLQWFKDNKPSNCTVLVDDGGCPRIAEFTSAQGSAAITIGAPQYEWNTANKSDASYSNLTKLTENAISYLVSKNAIQ